VLPTYVIRAVLGLVRQRWSVEILTALADGPLRYTDLQHTITITCCEKVHGNTLTSTLQRLQDKGLVNRPAVDDDGAAYRLTSDGQQLVQLLAEIARWGQRHSATLGL
jgi:DNA-binding HxlR family transcriptional regulator